MESFIDTSGAIIRGINLFMKKIVSLLMGTIISIGVCGFTACTANDQAEVWTTDSTAVVFQNKKYASAKQDSIEIKMAKNEYEGGQIHIYAPSAVSSYDIEFSNLYSELGVIPKENIEVFATKYTKIDRVTPDDQTRGNVVLQTEIGDCIPDALIPFSAIKNYGENCIEKGKNQSLYFTVYTNENTPSGTYKGTAKLSIDGEIQVIDITCTVWDFVLQSQTQFQNFWGLFDKSEWGGPELDSSPEMAQKYFEFSLKYRMNGDILGFDGTGTAEDYVNLIKKYWYSYGFSSYRFHVEYKHSIYKGMSVDYNAQKLKEYLIAVAQASAEDKIDYLSKTYFYFSAVIDEPPYNTSYKECEEVHQLTKKLLNDVNEEMKVLLTGTDGYGFYLETVENTLLNIPNILTSQVSTYFALQNYDAKDFNYCFGGVQNLSNDVIEMEHEKGNDVWWYQNNFHYIDVGLLYERMIGWVAKANDVEGFLNWNASIHVDDEGYYFFDPYVQSEVYRDAFYSGDGFIMYPGRQYGIDGPVPSLRLMNWRDSMEDCAYIETVENYYAQKGLSADLYFNEMYIQLYRGGKVLIEESSLIQQFKEQIAQEILSNNEKDIFFGDAHRNNNIMRVSFAVSDEVVGVKYLGEALPIISGVNYLDMDLTKGSSLILEVELKDGTIKTITQNICGEFVTVDNFETLSDTVFKSTSDGKIEINTDEKYAIDGNSLKVSLKGSATDLTHRPGFYFNTSVLGELESVDILSLNIYNANEEMTFAVYLVVDGAETLYREITLENGWNYFEIQDFYSYATDGLSQIRFRTENFYEEDDNGKPIEKVFYLDTMSIVKR